MAVGVAVAGIISMSLAGLFKAGLRTFAYTLRQHFVLSNSRKAIAGDGNRVGLVWAASDAGAVTALSSSTLTLSTGGGSALSYSVAADNLVSTHLGVSKEQARGVTALELRYYNLDGSGRIMESTAAASAVFSTALATLAGSREKEYSFYSGAGLRNHP